MGHKVNPISLRIGIINTWDTKWYADKRGYARLFHEDIELRKVIKEKLKEAGVTRIEIQRFAKKTTITIHAAKPGLIIGRQGVAIEDLRDLLNRKFGKNFDVNIVEVSNPDANAILIADLVGHQIVKRVAYRRAVKLAVQKAMEAGVKGIKIQVSGRLNGVEIARQEYFKEGNIPLHTLRANIDYAKLHVFTTYGAIGVKVWLYKGMVFKKRGTEEAEPALEERRAAKPRHEGRGRREGKR